MLNVIFASKAQERIYTFGHDLLLKSKLFETKKLSYLSNTNATLYSIV
jgi:hypothetical protein